MFVCRGGVEVPRGKGPRPSPPVVCNAITCWLVLVVSVHCIKLVDMRVFMAGVCLTVVRVMNSICAYIFVLHLCCSVFYSSLPKLCGANESCVLQDAHPPA